MEVKYRSGNGQLECNFESKDAAGLFEQIAAFQEIFEHNGDYVINGETVPSTDVQFRVREVDGNPFYEKVYVGSNSKCWGFKFSYGQSKQKKGSLFPKFKNDGDNLVDGGGGWYKYTGGKNSAPSDDSGKGEDKPVKGKTDKAPF
jgi:hypothetical protein